MSEIDQARRAWPLPETVGAWSSVEQFRDQRPEAGQWVFWDDRVEAVLNGVYDSVHPLHVEVSPTYLCNFSCPWCSTRSAREEWSGEDVFSHPRASPLTVMRSGPMESVVDHLAEHRVEVMWVGGEPTMNPLLYPAVERLAGHGINQCVFTNGSLLNERHSRTLFDSGVVFVRVSLNSVTPEVHRRQHDYDDRRPYASRVLTNLGELARLRAQRASRTLLGVSIVVDAGNIDDVPATLSHLVELCGRHGHGAIDYAIVRPVFPMVGAHVDIDAGTRARFAESLVPGAPLVVRCEEAGIELVTPSASVAESGVNPLADDDLGCLAAGWFGEVTPTGEMLPCSDLYGDVEFAIGNVVTHSLDQIQRSPQRRDALARVAAAHCPSRRCPTNGRGHFFNRLFRDVERFRREGRMAEVRRWVDDLRTVLPRPEHSFFL